MSIVEKIVQSSLIKMVLLCMMMILGSFNTVQAAGSANDTVKPAIKTQKIGKTDIGDLYIVPTMVREDVLDGKKVLLAMTKEVFTNSEFIEFIQQLVEADNIVYCYQLYIFVEEAQLFYIPRTAYFDNQDNLMLEDQDDDRVGRDLKENKDAQLVYKAAKAFMAAKK